MMNPKIVNGVLLTSTQIIHLHSIRNIEYVQNVHIIFHSSTIGVSPVKVTRNLPQIWTLLITFYDWELDADEEYF